MTLIDWYLQLSITERLRAASRHAATLERLCRAASEVQVLGLDMLIEMERSRNDG